MNVGASFYGDNTEELCSDGKEEMKLSRKLRSLLPKIYRWYWPECPEKDKKFDVIDLLPRARFTMRGKSIVLFSMGVLLVVWLLIGIAVKIDLISVPQDYSDIGLVETLIILRTELMIVLEMTIYALAYLLFIGIDRRYPPAINWIAEEIA